MWKTGLVAMLMAFTAQPGFSQTDAFDRDMNTLWEVLWHQIGTPTRLVRWEQGIQVDIRGTEAAAHKVYTLQALQDVAQVAGVPLVDVSGTPAAAQANLRIEVVPDSELSDAQPCETRLDFGAETRIESATLKMRSGDARRCARHEAMHIMGLRGHPGGDTVLSYFTAEHDHLLPLDRVMLRAWYSPRARGGMTPFEVLPLLADELVAASPDRASAALARDRFLARTVHDMQAFAEGGGDVPGIVRRSGKATDDGVRFGRMEVSYFLGVAYLRGATVAADPEQAAHWLQFAAHMGSRPANALLGAGAATAHLGGKPAARLVVK